MEEIIQDPPSLATKLPKYRPPKQLGIFFQRTTHSIHTGFLGKSNFTSDENKHIGRDQTSGFALNWGKLKCQQNEQNTKYNFSSTIEKVHHKQLSSSHLAEKDGSRIAIGAKNLKQSNLLVSQKQDLNENLLSGLANSNRLTKNPQLQRASYSRVNSFKIQSNGYYNNKPPTGLMRPRANSATTRNFSNKALVQQKDNRKTFTNIRRSQSFSHSVSNSLLPSAHLVRSHSFNRDVDVLSPYETQQVPVSISVKPSLLSRTARQHDLPNGNESQIKSNITRTYPVGSASCIKKPGFSNISDQIVPSGYKFNRPSLLKPTRSQITKELITNGTKNSFVSCLTDNTESSLKRTVELTDEHNILNERDLVIDNYFICDKLEKQGSKDSSGEDIDELSISSLSSSDKNDLTEDFSDEFLDLDDGNKTILVESEKSLLEKSPVEFAEDLLVTNKRNVGERDDWIGMDIAVERDVQGLERDVQDLESDVQGIERDVQGLENAVNSFEEKRISPDMGYRDPSSLELSPSDSSDGTYMWDEEGMEPIGNVLPCGSYESSEMNSLDILNNLDSCDLEDDDLMLDVDLPEDTTCDNGKGETMSHFERTDWNRRQQAFWKRTPPRLNAQEQYHLSNSEHYHNGRMGLSENTVMLDEMTLRHMVQDCTAVKTQLLKLKRLLQQEGESGSLTDIPFSIPSTPEPQETGALWKTEELLNEIQQLKEESKKKDEKINQLELRLKATCKCQQESQEPKREKPKQYNKYTQTTWKRHSPPVLQCSTNNPSSSDIIMVNLIAQPQPEVPSKPEQPTQSSGSNNTDDLIKVPENELSVLLSTQLKINDVEDYPDKVKSTEEHTQSSEHLEYKKKVKKQLLNSDTPSPLSMEANKNQKSLIKPSSSFGNLQRPKTLQLLKPKKQATAGHQGIGSSQLQPVSDTHTLSQLSNGSQHVVTKMQQPLCNNLLVREYTMHLSSEKASDTLHKSCVVKKQSPSIQNKPGSRQQDLLAPANSLKLPTAELLPVHPQVPATESSQYNYKQIPKGSVLRPSSTFASKLKKPSSPKPDLFNHGAATHDCPKSLFKATSSVIPRSPSYVKEIQLESVENAAPKRQSRLPQPKTHKEDKNLKSDMR
ncbi:hypothetical protein GDO86_013134 [Hymenochirus boettgeri]|uniref:Coiled-coil serine rich protein 2 n=1 Tax=Hymenochirus boettgeri TaxID=247094 RepID=A0A8T2IQ34_9PIPI|nr:hypothetical protein GDO86_013134 [Hymenochirus boettgeri]